MIPSQGVPVVAQWERIQLVSMMMQVGSLASLSGLRIWHCCDLWCRLKLWLGSDVAVAVMLAAVALIGPLAWEPSYTMDAVLKSEKKKNRRRS